MTFATLSLSSRVLAVLASAAIAVGAAAQSYPSKTMTLIVPYGSGGIADAMARNIGQRLTAQTKQSVVIDNKPGAGGVLGLTALTKAPKDGYTFALTASSPMTIWPHLQKLPYDAERDVQPVVNMMLSPVVLFATPKFAGNFADLLGAAKAKPGQLSFATTGQGTVGHLILESLMEGSGASFIHVPYKAAGQLMTDALSGTFEVFVNNPSPQLFQQVRAGKLRMLAVAAPSRLEEFPAVPTFADAGFKNAQLYSTYGIVLPSGTPSGVLETLNREMNQALASPEMKALFAASEGKAVGGSANDYQALLRHETSITASIIRKANIKID
jgi:tripartite-type tricarboxylate transporter receptor subunit TctC